MFRKAFYPFQRARGTHVSGFTLLELVVVLAIILIAVALTLPVISRARARSQEIFCQGNLRILSTALTQYTLEYDDRYPFGHVFNKTNPTNGRPTDPSASYITWYSSIDKYLTSGSSEVIPLDAQSGFFDGATNRLFHAAFKCPSISSSFQQKIHYYQHGVVMPHATKEIPASFRAPGMPIVIPAKVTQLNAQTALLWDTPVWGSSTPVTPTLFWASFPETISGYAPWVTKIDFGLVSSPSAPELRFRGLGADRFATSVNPLKNPAGPIYWASDKWLESENAVFPTYNGDPIGEGLYYMVGSARFRHTGLGCNVLFADGSVRTLYLRPWRKVANSPPGTGSADFVDSDFRRYMLMIKWPVGFSDTHTVPTHTPR